ncbi:MAG: sorbosone dehydrogenase family protein, partial [Leptolyngbyaceae cyanobacterium CAN_BIN12]|nr:sorbosone dehydrogenase family protein [Leptolyngbyaceae cyanobacterium CAN_BIN12]
MYRLSFLLLLGCTLAACRTADTSRATLPATSSVQAEASSTTKVAQAPEASLIRTQTLLPNPIKITPESLPQPYTSNSASKSPNVLPIPANPTLQVPAGFVVNVFAEGLDRPRWLALTPSGDVLVTETRQNQIQLLRDANQDGVAEVKKTFATSQNGLNIPFGMAFSNDAFFLGNSAAVLRFPYSKGQEQLTGRGTKITDLPGGGYNQHWTRNV